MANRSRGKFDVTIDTGDAILGYVLARETGKPAVVPIEMGPGRTDEMIRNADVPRVIDNLEAGMGFSRRIEQVPNGYAFCLPGYTRAPGAILCPAGKLTEITLPAAGSGWTPGTIFDSVLFRDKINLVNDGPHMLELDPTAEAASVSAYFGAGFVGWGAAVFQNRLWVSGGTGGLANQDGVSGGWAGPVSSVVRYKMATTTWRPLGIPTPMLIGVSPGTDPLDFASSVRWCPVWSDPLVDANWSAPVQVGENLNFSITNLVAAPRHVYMLRFDGVWDMDELGTRAVNIAPWMQETPENAYWGMHVGSGLYLGHNQGIAFIPTDGTAQHEPIWAHPGWGLPYEGSVRGVAVAMTLHEGWRIAALTDNVDSYILAGMPSQTAYGQATHVWHGAEAVVPDRISHMKVYAQGPGFSWPRLLITTTDLGDPPTVRAYWQSLTKVGSPVQEMLLGGEFEPAASSSLLLPADPWNRPSSVKTMLQFDLLTERLSDSDYFRLYANADAGSYVEQGVASEGAYTSLTPVHRSCARPNCGPRSGSSSERPGSTAWCWATTKASRPHGGARPVTRKPGWPSCGPSSAGSSPLTTACRCACGCSR
jgi:hypothetical protein